jgi:hypothetical protein
MPSCPRHQVVRIFETSACTQGLPYALTWVLKERSPSPSRRPTYVPLYLPPPLQLPFSRADHAHPRDRRPAHPVPPCINFIAMLRPSAWRVESGGDRNERERSERAVMKADNSRNWLRRTTVGASVSSNGSRECTRYVWARRAGLGRTQARTRVEGLNFIYVRR